MGFGEGKTGEGMPESIVRKVHYLRSMTRKCPKCGATMHWSNPIKYTRRKLFTFVCEKCGHILKFEIIKAV